MAECVVCRKPVIHPVVLPNGDLCHEHCAKQRHGIIKKRPPPPPSDAPPRGDDPDDASDE